MRITELPNGDQALKELSEKLLDGFLEKLGAKEFKKFYAFKDYK